MSSRNRSWLAIGCLAAGFAVACSASPPLAELSTAEQMERDGNREGAVDAYRRAQVSCKKMTPPRRAKQACANALLGEAEILERIDEERKTRSAIDAYLAIPTKAPDDPSTAATALYRAGELLLRTGDATGGWTALWKVVTDYPDEAPASDALRALVLDGRGRDPQALADQMTKLLTPLAKTEAADNLLWSLADLTEHELKAPKAARTYYDRIPQEHPKSGLRDDARWNAARISHDLGDYTGEVQRLRALLATRDVAWFNGSYFSVWLDDAQLKLGIVLRDNLHDLPGAIAAFERLPKDYDRSILRDDALFELAVTYKQAGNATKACATIAKLKKDWPDSKYVARSAEAGC
ncbi:MAG TPA: tetratricopeptide repeat protein [Kofleriaceae bacterium]